MAWWTWDFWAKLAEGVREGGWEGGWDAGGGWLGVLLLLAVALLLLVRAEFEEKHGFGGRFGVAVEREGGCCRSWFVAGEADGSIFGFFKGGESTGGEQIHTKGQMQK